MPKIKVAEATGRVLDYLVAVADGWSTAGVNYPYLAVKTAMPATRWTDLRYSTDWPQGGPIIERERIYVYPHPDGGTWLATLKGAAFNMEAGTPLIAAMRCYVSSKLGDEVEVPEELL